ncbi:MAG: hypothetical protein KAJ88_03210 [Candidatus Aenigmarchaeota archaeon]|nr:hypothetical protein [Candidatus Aenigmarchaeota archaeon]
MKEKILIICTIILIALLPSTAYAATTDISISDIDITPKKIYQGEMAQITVDLDIETPEDESKVTLSFYIDGDLEKKVTRYYSEKSHSYTYSYDTEDTEIGTHTVEVVTRIYRGTSTIKAEDSMTKKLEIEEKAPVIDVTMNVYPKDVTVNENIQVFGYVDPTDEIISIFVDGIAKKTTVPDINGFYSTYLKIGKTGDHVITASVSDSKKHKIVNVAEKPEITEIMPEEPKKDIIITIIEPEPEKDEDIDKETDQETEEEKEEEIFSYITVEASNKILDINQYESNIVRITITNYEDRSHLFSIDTNFANEMIFIPQPEVIKPGQSKILPLYFSADENPGRHYGIIYVRNEERIVSEIPLTVFISENDYIKETVTQPIGPAAADMLMILVAIIAIVLMMGITHRITKRTTRPLEVSDIGRPTTTLLKKLHETTEKGAKARPETAYLVPWSNIVI